MLDLAVLGLLREHPRHGYELRRALAELGYRRVSFGALYPALRRLERRGWIEASPETGRRRTYGLTAAGAEAFVELLSQVDPEESDRAFQTRLAFLGRLEPSRRIAVLEARRRALAERLRRVRDTLRRARSVDRYRRASMERNVRTAEADIAWLDQLIAAERAGAGT